MNIVTQILSFFGNYTPMVSFVGAIVGGEETLVLLAILAARGTISLWYVVVFFYMGIMVSDSLWYFVGTSRLFNWLVRIKLISNTYDHWGKLVDQTTKSPFQALFATKFLYGFRIPTIMYLAREKLTLGAFIQYSLVTNALWVAVIVLLGWLAGKGIGFANTFSNNIVLDLFLIGVTIIFITVLTRIISQYMKIWLRNK